MAMLRTSEPRVGMNGPRRQLFKRAPVDPTGADAGGRPPEIGPAQGPDNVRMANFRRMMQDMGGGGVKAPMPPAPAGPPPPMPMEDYGGGAVKQDLPGFIGSGNAVPRPAPGAGFDFQRAAEGGINGGAAVPKPDFTGDQGPAMAKQPPPEIEDERRIDEQSYF